MLGTHERVRPADDPLRGLQGTAGLLRHRGNTRAGRPRLAEQRRGCPTQRVHAHVQPLQRSGGNPFCHESHQQVMRTHLRAAVGTGFLTCLI